jgi:DNA-binding response OmpR family regulator
MRMDDPLALIIEDDASQAEVFTDALTRAGFRVEAAQDGEGALARLAAITPMVVVLDMRLPFVSGDEILRRIRADPRLAPARVILTTGDSRAAAALEQEADLVLVKPVSYTQLRELAERMRADATGDIA